MLYYVWYPPQFIMIIQSNYCLCTGEYVPHAQNIILHIQCIIIQVQQLQSLGIDWNGPLPFSDDNIVNADPPQLPLSPQDYQELCIQVNPLEPSSEYGIELYIETVQFVINKVMACSNE